MPMSETISRLIEEYHAAIETLFGLFKRSHFQDTSINSPRIYGGVQLSVCITDKANTQMNGYLPYFTRINQYATN